MKLRKKILGYAFLLNLLHNRTAQAVITEITQLACMSITSGTVDLFDHSIDTVDVPWDGVAPWDGESPWVGATDRIVINWSSCP